MSVELKPCPFCGGEAQAGAPANDIGCSDWRCAGYAHVSAESWNTRAPSPALAAAKALAEACEPLNERLYVSFADLRRIRYARAALLKALEAGDA